jgi:hypothetical protein
MKNLNCMLNNDLPSIFSGREPFTAGHHRMSYLMFHSLCAKNDFPLCFASPYDYDWENGKIRGWWASGDDGFSPWEEPFHPAFIFDKASGADPQCDAVMQNCESRGIPIYGSPGLARLCSDKWRCYLQFTKFSPLTALLTDDRKELIDQIYAFFEEMDRTYAGHDNKALAKPLHGFQSRGIHLISRHPHGLEMHMLFGGQIHGVDINKNLDTIASTPYLIQAWVNTGEGIPGVGLKGQFHDVRFVFRIRKKGLAEFIMLYIKTLQGMLYVPLEQLRLSDPFEIVNPLADAIAEQFPFGVFSVDVMRDISGRWFLTELNDQVGLTLDFNRPEEVREMTRFMNIYIEEFKKLAASK